MDPFPATVKSALVATYTDYAGRVRELAAGLSDEQCWIKPYPYGNSFGHLVLHLTGNLNTYIGAQIAGTGYVRDREREFTEPSQPSKEDVLQNFDRAIVMVVETLRAQSAEHLAAPPVEADGAHFNNRSGFGVFLHCAAHLNHHVGQMIYLERELNRS